MATDLPGCSFDLKPVHGNKFFDSENDEDDDENSQKKEIQHNPRIDEKLSVYSTFHGYDVHKAYAGEKIKVGLRVVRPPSSESENDNKFENSKAIGTIVHLTESGMVKVQWDTGGNDEFKKGDNNQFDLLLYDNAQIGVIHPYVKCDGCDVYPLRGIRWKCKICGDYDLCTDCYMNNEHDRSHIFKRILSTDSKGEQMPPRENQKITHALGIQPNAIVYLYGDHKHKGRVKKFLENAIETYRSDAKVHWHDNFEGSYRVGRNGQCDLKFTVATKGPMYYEQHLPIATVENLQKGARVVRGPGWDDDNVCDGGLGYLGTVTHVGDFKGKYNITAQEESVKNKHSKRMSKLDMVTLKLDVKVQWDNGNIEDYSLSSNCLRLFDNGPSGVYHEGYVCDCCRPKEYIRGIRWKCKTCHDFDLCNICYMSDEHDLGHIFQRIVTANVRDNMPTPREHPRSAVKRQSYGIFKDATVVEVDPDKDVSITDEKTGTVKDICDCKVDTGRSEVEVMWFKDRSKSSHRILDLKYLSGGAFFYYYDHLPALGRDSQGYFAVNFDLANQATKKIQVDIWRTIQQVKKDIYKPSLYLIFANHTDLDKKESKGDKNDKLDMVLMEEVLDFAKKTKLPCHVVGQKVLFHSGSNHAVFIHYKTEKDTVKELVEKGFRKFERGDMDEENGEDEIHYFLRMAKYVSGEAVLPVVISLRNGGMTTEVMTYTAKSKIPIIRLKKHSLDVSILTHQSIDDDSVQMTEHITDIKNPWSIKTSKPRDYTLGKYDGKDDPDEIAVISKIQSEFPDNLDALVCCLLIGVSMVEGSIEKEIFGSYTKVYPNALSMYLLKEGKWRIPKENIKTSFDYRSLEYIFEQDMTAEIKNGLWSYLQSMTNMAYKTPDFRVKKVDDSKDEDESAKASKTDEDNKITSKIAKTKIFLNFKKDKPKKKKRKQLELKVSTSELYGLILYALLKKQYWNGAQQLIETGCIRIRYILIGCVILEDEISNWRTNSFLKEKLQRLKSAITQRAIRITSCINEADKKKKDVSAKIKDVSAKIKKNKLQSSNKDSEKKEEQQLGEHINHAGRLLVNHGYIEDAIKTQNKTFLDNSTVRNILNEMWYGTEKLDKRTSVRFFGLAVVHIIVLPLLMISMEAGPLIRFYKKYNLPFMKVSLQMFGFLTLNTAYAYMLLFDYSDDRITYSDYFIIVWMVSFFVDETKQLIVSIIRKKWKSYASDCWNQLDWLSIIVYASGMLIKSCQGPRCRDASKVLLVAAFIFLSIRILNLFCMSAMLGPKLVMIRKMARDTVSFMIIMAVIMMCYNISFYALLYPNSELSWLQIEKIIQNGYWMLFGELNLDSVTLSEPHCTFNRTVYENTDVPRCPAKLGVYLTPYLKALYGLIAVILLLNLLIAMYSDTFQKVHKESEFYWAQIQTDFLEEYSIKTVFPVHLQLLVLPATIVHAIFWFSCPHLCGKIYKIFRDQGSGKRDTITLNHRPMFVRVFLYNTNFDLKLKTTKEAEGNGALKAKGEIDLSEVDRITMLQRQMDTNSKKQDKQNEKQDKQNEKNGKQNEKIMENMQHVDKKLKGIKTMLSKIAKTLENFEDQTEDEDDDYQFGFLSSDKNDSDSQSVSSDDYVRRPNINW